MSNKNITAIKVPVRELLVTDLLVTRSRSGKISGTERVQEIETSLCGTTVKVRTNKGFYSYDGYLGTAEVVA